MNNSEITQYICVGLVGATIYIGFLVMFVWAVWKGELIFHYVRIRGKLARAVGLIGLVGMTAGTYLMVSLFIFETTPPLASLAGFLLGLVLLTLFVVRSLSIFIWHQ